MSKRIKNCKKKYINMKPHTKEEICNETYLPSTSAL